jgi:tetratricopeptide (TPR) repeat protein
VAVRPAPPDERFVGRIDELRTVDEACSAAAEGRGGTLIVVSGEAGIGKTRFCDEVAGRARAGGMGVSVARCWMDGGSPALWPWQPILADVCGTEAANLLAPDEGASTVDPDRFARFRAVTERLAAACRDRPLCLVIDDVHGADVGSLLLTRFVARSLHPLRVALVLSRRTGAPAADGTAALLNEIEREALPVVLRRFDLEEVRAFLAVHGMVELDPDLVLALRRVTAGNPLFLRRIAALGAPDRMRSLPAGVHAAIEQASAGLSDEVRRRLQAGAILGQNPSVAEAAAVAGCDQTSILEAVDAGVAAGLVVVDGPARFTFSHEMVRAALEDALPPADRLDAHAAAAAAGDEAAVSPDRLARRAHHALAAAPRSTEDARGAVVACRSAARSMVRSFAYERADALLSAAIALHEQPGIGPAPGPLLIEWAQAAWLCGRLAEARVRFERAVTVAEDEGDPVMFAEAALGLGGHWLNEHRSPVARVRVLGLQRAALAGLGPEHAALRCRLVARLAAEAVYDRGPVSDVHRALAAARRSGDSTALAEALSLCHHALLAPDHARGRLGLADDLVRVASEAGHGVLALMGLCWRAVDLFLLGDEGAVRALEELRERADALACQAILYIVDVLDVMLLVRAGRLGDAEAAAERCFDRGVEVGEVDTIGYFGAHLLAIRWIQGRDAELGDLAEEVASSPTLVDDEFAFRATSALLAARAGHIDRARVRLAALVADGVGALPRSSTWLMGMTCIVETATVLGDAAVARACYDLLAPFSDLPVMPSLAVVCLGSTERVLGVAAMAFGNPDLAVRHLERAIEATRAIDNRPLVPITQAELAHALHARDGEGDAARAAALLAEAADTAGALGLTVRADAWRAERAALEGGTDVVDIRVPARARGGAPTSSPRRGVIRRQGRRWLVELAERRVVVGDLVGMEYLAELVTHPGETIPVLELAGRGQALVDGVPQEVLDDAARAAYAARVSELRDDLSAAEADADLGRAERVRAELDALVDELEAATGLGGRARQFGRPSERARTAVRKALKRAIDEIDAADHQIGELLRSSIVTGSACAYSPQADADVVVDWSVGTSDAG